ncbi:MAG: YraN family protein [Planctomycetes bacterium]|nr:YraN family protein [Planctomycetota bacterium]MCC7170625.1 YraN family protein [Planctomycetota bacterium]
MRDDPSPANDVGRHGEDLALLHLESLGFTLVERNARVGRAEIDLVVRDAGGFAFVEVKTRRTARHGEPWAAVDTAKRVRLERAAVRYLERVGEPDADWRLGVVAIVVDADGAITNLDWIDEVS